MLHRAFAFLFPSRVNASLVFGIPLPIPSSLGILFLVVSLVLLLASCAARGRLGWVFLLAGSGGIVNALDRILIGGVSDYFTLPFFPFTFNLPDVLLTLAGVLLLLPARKNYS